ncbi:MAG: penicillin-binding protein 2 [Candidatus Krumholzibacteriia bacterium]
MGGHLSRADEARTARTAYAIVVCIFTALALRLFDVQVLEHRRYERLARENQFRVKRVVAPRGVLRDRHGRSLGDNVAEYQLFIHSEVLKTGDSLLAALAADFGVDTTAGRERWKAQRARRRQHLPVKVLGNLSKAQLSRFEENQDLYPGAFLEARGRRRYIHGDFATHVLGYVGEVTQEQVESSEGPRAYRLGDVAGKSGVEALYEEVLRGLDGRRWVQVNAAGQELFELVEKAEPPVPGHDVYLTIDFDLQHAIEKRFWPEGRAGAAVVMDVHTGELLAAVSKPGYDLNRFSIGISTAEYDALRSDPLTPLFNRYSVAAYPPGSTFKIVSSTALLEHRVARTNELKEACPGWYRVGNRIFRCHKEGGHGSLRMLGGFVQSCDVYYYQQARALGIDRLAQTARRLGFGRRTGFALPEVGGLIPDTPYYDRTLGKRGWTWAVAVNCIIGQGEVLVTPLQLARVAAAVANGGRLVQPQIVRRVVDAHGRVVQSSTPKFEEETLFSPHVLRFLRNAMLRVVADEKGTAHSALPESLFVAGKTGTAETPGKQEDHAWFVFFAPHDNPQIAGVVIVERAGHGGAVSAPIARKIVSQHFGIRDRGVAYWRRLPELRRKGFVRKETS